MIHSIVIWKQPSLVDLVAAAAVAPRVAALPRAFCKSSTLAAWPENSSSLLTAHQLPISALVQPALVAAVALHPPLSGDLQPKHFLQPRTPGPCSQLLALSATAQVGEGLPAGPTLHLSGGLTSFATKLFASANTHAGRSSLRHRKGSGIARNAVKMKDARCFTNIATVPALLGCGLEGDVVECQPRQQVSLEAGDVAAARRTRGDDVLEGDVLRGQRGSTCRQQQQQPSIRSRCSPSTISPTTTRTWKIGQSPWSAARLTWHVRFGISGW
jgi:hypothetical protein